MWCCMRFFSTPCKISDEAVKQRGSTGVRLGADTFWVLSKVWTNLQAELHPVSSSQKLGNPIILLTKHDISKCDILKINMNLVAVPGTGLCHFKKKKKKVQSYLFFLQIQTLCRSEKVHQTPEKEHRVLGPLAYVHIALVSQIDNYRHCLEGTPLPSSLLLRQKTNMVESSAKWQTLPNTVLPKKKV